MKEVLAEILTIGDELLYGQVIDTNSAWLGRQLAGAGIRTVQRTSVGDREADIEAALEAALARAQVVLITGGLGPTKDDITKKTLARFFGSEMAIHEPALVALHERFAARGRELNELNRLQAELPVAARYIPNERGTAPGMWFDHAQDRVVVSMPGVPLEMQHMMSTYVLPQLQEQYVTPIIRHSFVQTSGIPESDLALRIQAWEEALPAHIRLAYLPSRGRVKLRLTGTGDEAPPLEQELKMHVEALLPLLGHSVFALTDETLEQVLAARLTDKGYKIAAAESCTGGAFASRLTASAGASKFFTGSVVVYTQAAKLRLGVPAGILERFGVVSAETAGAMAKAARDFYKTDLAMSSTGIAGPASPEDEQPVGTIFIACAHAGGTKVLSLKLLPDRELNIELTVNAMLDLARRVAEGVE